MLFRFDIFILNVRSKDIPKCMKRFPGAKDFSKRQRTKKKARKSIRHNIIDKRGRRILKVIQKLCKNLIRISTSE